MNEILEAVERIRPHVHRTPLLRTDLDDRLRLKAECFQLTGSFKARGAFNAVIAKRAADPSMKGVIAVSSGNHAQALALAARSVGLKAVILIPADANPEKVQRTREYGAQVIQDGITFANREQRLREEIEGSGLVLVHPFDDWDVIHGQGTVAKEMLDDDPAIAHCTGDDRAVLTCVECSAPTASARAWMWSRSSEERRSGRSRRSCVGAGTSWSGRSDGSRTSSRATC